MRGNGGNGLVGLKRASANKVREYLVAAAKTGNVEGVAVMVDRVLQLPLDLKKEFDFGVGEALKEAVKGGKSDIVEAIVGEAQVLKAAIEYGNEGLALDYLEKCKKMDSKTKNEVFHAVLNAKLPRRGGWRDKRIKIVQGLIDSGEVDIDKMDDQGRLPILKSVGAYFEIGDDDKLRDFLLDRGASMEKKDSPRGGLRAGMSFYDVAHSRNDNLYDLYLSTTRAKAKEKDGSKAPGLRSPSNSVLEAEGGAMAGSKGRDL